MPLCLGQDSILPLAVVITLGTTTYHLLMRLAVGHGIDVVMHNRANPQSWWFVQRSWEPGLYKALRVKRWKAHMPTYSPEIFDPRQRSWDQIAQAMCQSELVHEAIAVLSFLPLAVCLACGDTEDVPVFAATSVVAACFDLVFVVMQRYNRPRALRLAARRRER